MKIAKNGCSVRTPKGNSDDLTRSWFIRNGHFSYFTLFLQLLFHSLLLLPSCVSKPIPLELVLLPIPSIYKLDSAGESHFVPFLFGSNSPHPTLPINSIFLELEPYSFGI